MSGLDEGMWGEGIAAGSILLIMPTLCAHVDCGMHILFDIKAAKLISWDYHGGCIQIQQMEIVFRPDYSPRVVTKIFLLPTPFTKESSS